MMNKGFLSLILAFSLALALLTGCGAPSAHSSPDASAVSGGNDETVSSAPVSEEEDIPSDITEEPIPEADLTWESKTERQESTTSDGTLIYYNQLDYPVFAGKNVEMLNNWVEAYVHPDVEYETGEFGDSNPDSLYEQYLEDFGDEETLQMYLPFFEELMLDEVYADSFYVSVTGYWTFWSGGAHPYSYRCGAVLFRDTGEEVPLMDLVGDEENLIRLATSHDVSGELADLPHHYAEPESWNLNENGMTLYYNIGDAIPRAEIFIPWNELSVG